MSANHTPAGPVTSKCYQRRCRTDAEFAVDQMSWRDLSCARHLGVLIVRRTAAPMSTATVTRLGEQAAQAVTMPAPGTPQ